MRKDFPRGYEMRKLLFISIVALAVGIAANAMQINGPLIGASLERLTTAPATPNIGRIYYDTTAGSPMVCDGASCTTIVTPAQMVASLGYTPEDVANKSTAQLLGSSDTLYPTQHAVKVYIDTAFSASLDTTLGALDSQAKTATGAAVSGRTFSLQTFDGTHPGLVPSSGGGTTNFLRADGSWAVAGTGTVTGVTGTAPIASSGGTAPAISLNANGVANTHLAQMGAHTYKGNNTASTANAADITSTQLTADLNLFSSTLQGLVPASGGGTTNFLRADGSWAAAGAGTVTAVSVASANGFAGTSSGGTTPALTLSTSITGPLKGNGTAISAAASSDIIGLFSTCSGTQYLGADGACHTPSSGFTNPMTTLGDIMYEDATPVAARLAGNTTSTKKYLSQTGTGTISAVPAWSQPTFSELSGTATVAQGGTGLGTLTTHSVLIGEGTSNVAFAGPNASSGIPLISQGSSADPIFGTATVGGGGTGLTSGTSGGIPYFNASSTMASSAALTANQLVIGGGAGAAPAGLGSLGTTTTVLHGNAAGAPSFGAVSLTADVSGTLPAGNGGTGQTSVASAFTSFYESVATTLGDLVYGGASGAPTRLAGNITTAPQVLTSTGNGSVAAAPTWQSLTAIGITSDWTAYTPTFSASFGTTSGVSGFYRRNGDSIEGSIILTGGIFTAAVGAISLPSGLSIDTTKVTAATASSGNAGGGNMGSYTSDDASGSGGGISVATTTSTTNVYMMGKFSNSSSAGSDRFINMTTFGNTSAFHIRYVVPISQWSSNTVGVNQGAVSAFYFNSTSRAVTSGNQINFDTKLFDTGCTSGSCIVTTGSTWKATAPVSGSYHIEECLDSSSGTTDAQVFVNGSLKTFLASVTATSNAYCGGTDLSLNVGDTVDLRPDASVTLSGAGSASATHISFTLNSGNASTSAVTSWNGFHSNDCDFSFTAASFVDPNTDSTCTFTTRTSNGMTVTSYQSGGNNGPGITFTPTFAPGQTSAGYHICVNLQTYNNNASRWHAFRFYDGTTAYTTTNVWLLTASRMGTPSMCFTYSTTSTSAISIRLQAQIDTTGTTGDISSQANATPAIEWDVVKSW